MSTSLGATPLRKDFVPKDAYLSRDFVRLEYERLWPKVWQIACRLEEIPKVGDYVVYDIGAESIVVVRTAADSLKAYYNVCQHRGRRLADGGGHTAKFHCRFHGWQWNIDGTLAHVVDRFDWEGCPDFSDAALHLKEVRVDTWGGWVWVNMDMGAEPLRGYLAPVPEYLDPYEFGKMRYRWYKTVIVPCNWKVALEAFSEAYHVQQTHPQLMRNIGEDITQPHVFGRHAMFAYFSESRPYGTPSPRTGKPVPADLRADLVDYINELERDLRAITSPRSVEAAARLLTEAPPGLPPLQLLGMMMEFQKQAAIASGAGWPDLSFEQMLKAGTNWHVFPNMVTMMAPDGALSYRFRPNGDDPDSCIFDIWSLVRYAPGAEPSLVREFHPEVGNDAEQIFGRILAQDFANMADVQRGMKSRGFAGGRTNPNQEASIANFHRELYQYLFDAR